MRKRAWFLSSKSPLSRPKILAGAAFVLLLKEKEKEKNEEETTEEEGMNTWGVSSFPPPFSPYSLSLS